MGRRNPPPHSHEIPGKLHQFYGIVSGEYSLRYSTEHWNMAKFTELSDELLLEIFSYIGKPLHKLTII